MRACCTIYHPQIHAADDVPTVIAYLPEEVYHVIVMTPFRFNSFPSLPLRREKPKAPTFLTIQVSRNILNEAIRNLNVYAAPRVETPSELLLTADEISAIINQGDLSRTLLLSAAHLKRIEVRTLCFKVIAPVGYHTVDRAQGSEGIECRGGEILYVPYACAGSIRSELALLPL